MHAGILGRRLFVTWHEKTTYVHKIATPTHNRVSISLDSYCRFPMKSCINLLLRYIRFELKNVVKFYTNFKALLSTYIMLCHIQRLKSHELYLNYLAAFS